MKMSKSQWENVGRMAGWIGTSRKVVVSQGQPQPQGQQVDELDSLLMTIANEHPSISLTLLEKMYGRGIKAFILEKLADHIRQQVQAFVSSKIQKYKAYPPEKRQEYLRKIKEINGQAHIFNW